MIGSKGRIVLVHVDMALKIGRIEAMLLSQIDYWLERKGRLVDGHFWVYNTMAEWGRQIGVSESGIKRAVHNLEKLGLIQRRCMNHHGYDRTMSYTICYEKLQEMGFAGKRRSLAEQEAADPWDKPWVEQDGYFTGQENERTGEAQWLM